MTSERKHDLTFFTATILDWRPLLANDRYKDIVMESLRFLVREKRIELHAFVLMINHIHLIWRIIPPNNKENVHRDFLGFTAKRIIKDLQSSNNSVLNNHYVNSDRKYQIWERNPLSIAIWSENVLKQKLEYIHQNPVRANCCTEAYNYKYSSAGLYNGMLCEWDFVIPCFLPM